MSDIAVRKLIYLAFLIVFLILVVFYFSAKNPPSSITAEVYSINEHTNVASSNFKPDSDKIFFMGNYFVDYITDGDTIHVKNLNATTTEKDLIIRLLVVNTPEIHKDTARNICLGKMSADFTKANLLNKNVELWGDSTQPKLDKYGRTLAYVRISDTSSPVASTTQFFNDTLMQLGYAKIYKSSPEGSEYKKYLGLQTLAQQQNLQMWNSQLCN